VKRPKDPLSLLAPIYAFGTNDEAWLSTLVDALEPFDLGGGIAAYTSDLGPTIRLKDMVNRTRLPTSIVTGMTELLPAPFYRRLHAPMPVNNSVDFFPKAAADVGLTFELSMDFPLVPPPAAWAFCGGDVNVETAIAVFHCQPDQAFSTRDRQALDYVSAHLSAAVRLRTLLPRGPSADAANVEAIFSPDGHVLDARGDIRDSEARRAPLIDAIRRSERAKLRRATDVERLETWTALVEGRWSILESTERDGKRLLLACRNEPRTGPLRVLDDDERAVCEYAALGHSFKFIAYELGISIATAATYLETALRKLGLASRADLIRFFARRQPNEDPSASARLRSSS
jgi:DNA-binding NarL/FixJ family response regulator